jgi:hypothetical protein
LCPWKIQAGVKAPELYVLHGGAILLPYTFVHVNQSPCCYAERRRRTGDNAHELDGARISDADTPSWVWTAFVVFHAARQQSLRGQWDEVELWINIYVKDIHKKHALVVVDPGQEATVDGDDSVGVEREEV